MTAWVTVSPRYASASRFSFCRMRAEISWAVYALPSMSMVQSVPMWRLTERMVRSGLVMAWRLATSPTSTSPVLEKPTTDGVVRPPSALGMTVGSPASSTLTTELVVPRSIPTALAMSAVLPVVCRVCDALSDIRVLILSTLLLRNMRRQLREIPSVAKLSDRLSRFSDGLTGRPRICSTCSGPDRWHVRTALPPGRAHYDRAVLDLVLLRHGQSTWNAENLFTGWVDVDLTPAGEAEARAGGRAPGRRGRSLDLRILHTSVLTRAIRTAELALAAAGRSWLPVRRDWRLNERHYGDLQGKNKAEIRPAVRRRAAPGLAAQLRHPAARRSPPTTRYAWPSDPRYRDLDPADIPPTECLADVVARVLPYWESAIVPDLRAAAEQGGAVLVAAHGNSLRALRKHLDGISDDDITGLEIPTGIPLPLCCSTTTCTVHSADLPR